MQYATPATPEQADLNTRRAVAELQRQVRATGAGQPASLTGATAATRYAGGTTSGPPTSGTFTTGDFVVSAAGRVWVCTAGGTPGTWVQPTLAQPAFRRAQAAAQDIPSSGTTWTTIAWDAAPTLDTDGGWTSTSTYTVPAQGIWDLSYVAGVTTSATSGAVWAAVMRNGVPVEGMTDSQGFYGATQTSQHPCKARMRVPLSLGDALTLRILQTSGATTPTTVYSAWSGISPNFGFGVVFEGHLVHH